MNNLIKITDEKDVKAKMVHQLSYKKGTWMDEGPTGKQFAIDCMKTNSPVEVKRQGVLENGVQYIDVRIYFKTDDAF